MTDLSHNPFYNFLRHEARHQYQKATLNRWIICIPTSESTKDIPFSQEFIDSHFLKPNSYVPSKFNDSIKSFITNTNPELHYELKDDKLTLVSVGMDYSISIISKEIGYNSEFHSFHLFVIDKPLNPSLKPIKSLLNIQQTKLACYNDVLKFLNEFFEQRLSPLNKHLSVIEKNYTRQNVESLIREEVKNHWTEFLQLYPIEWQRNSKFQYLISLSLENFVIENTYKTAFPLICLNYQGNDRFLLEKCQQLSDMRITADQLGASEDYAIPLPAAVVELATLDTRQSPIEKLLCLRTAYDLVLAELKGAIVDALCRSPVDDAPVIFKDDNIVPLLMIVVIRSKQMHMASNLYFMENLQWTLLPHDDYTVSLNAFKMAIEKLIKTDIKLLPPRSPKIHVELGLDDLIKVTDELNEKFDRRGKSLEMLSPVDRHMERLTAMIAASTEEISRADYDPYHS